MREDLHTFAGAYALGALPDEAERRAFEEHLARCEACAAEVRGFRETAARLGTAVARTPPPGLRDRVLAEIGEVRRLPPVVADGGEVVPLRRRWPRPAVVLAAACLVAAVVSGGIAFRAQQRLDRAESANRAVAAVLSAPDARTVTGRVASGGTATVVASRSRGQVVFASSGLRRLPQSRTYEMWLIGPGRTRPAGLLRPDASGRTRAVLAGALGDADTIGLTVEPAGGSAQPTTTPIVALKL